MEREGWIKDYRKEIDSDIWVMPPLYLKVWQYLKYMVNHKPNSIPMSNGTKELVERGQHLTSYRSIAKGVSYYENRVYKEPSPKTIKKILDWLIKNNMITINNGRGNRQYTKVTIVNYNVYQDENSDGVTQKEQSGNSEETVRKQTLPINKNEKNDKRMIKNEEEDIDVQVHDSSNKLQEVIDNWNRLNLNKVISIKPGTNRYKLLQARIKEYSLEQVIEAINNIKSSNFLKGQNNKGWTITLDWLVKPNNFLKVLEKNYQDKGDANDSRSNKQNKYRSFEPQKPKLEGTEGFEDYI